MLCWIICSCLVVPPSFIGMDWDSSVRRFPWVFPAHYKACSTTCTCLCIRNIILPPGRMRVGPWRFTLGNGPRNLWSKPYPISAHYYFNRVRIQTYFSMLCWCFELNVVQYIFLVFLFETVVEFTHRVVAFLWFIFFLYLSSRFPSTNCTCWSSWPTIYCVFVGIIHRNDSMEWHLIGHVLYRVGCPCGVPFRTRE